MLSYQLASDVLTQKTHVKVLSSFSIHSMNSVIICNDINLFSSFSPERLIYTARSCFFQAGVVFYSFACSYLHLLHSFRSTNFITLTQTRVHLIILYIAIIICLCCRFSVYQLPLMAISSTTALLTKYFSFMRICMQ